MAGTFAPWNPASAFQPAYGYQSPLASFGVSTLTSTPVGAPLQQIVQLLQHVPQHLQQLQQQGYLQLQQIQQLQQIISIVPSQLAQLQQLLQLHQSQQASFQPAFGQVSGLGALAGTPPFVVSPQIFGAQPGQVM